MDMEARTPHQGTRTRRELLKMAPLAAAGLLLSDGGRSWLVRSGLSLSDRASMAVFRSHHLAPTFADRDVTPLDRFPLNSYLADDPDVDLDAWRLDVSGLVQRPGAYPLDALQRLPKAVRNTRHICIEGWDVVGNFGGVPMAAFLDHVGADASAGFLEAACADDYYESIDMASARHPQSLLCYEMYGEPLTRSHGAPLRLVLPTKLGYKQAKYVVAIKVTNVRSARRGYWEDQGYPWHGGL
jgi:DMSO/TMAO reductase YedYZ molybdopterin-dependent catalytic subunit